MTDEPHQQHAERTLGRILRDIRESKSLGLRTIALRLKIDQRQLEALENDNVRAFPAHVYARGVFEKYADFLGLDRNEALRLFERMWQNEKVFASPSPALKPKTGFFTKAGGFILKKFFIGGVIGVFFLACGLGAWMIIAEMPGFTFDEPADRTITSERHIIVRGSADPRIELTLNKQLIYIGENGLFRRAVLLQEGVNELVLEGTTSLGKTSKIIKYVVVQ